MTNVRQQVERLVVQESMSDDEVRALPRNAVTALIDVFRTASGDLRELRSRNALHALGVLGTRKAVDFLIAAAEDPDVDEWLREAAVRSLGPAKDSRAVTYLTSLLDSPDVDVRGNAVRALNHSESARAARALRRVAETDPDEKIRRRARQRRRDGELADTRERRPGPEVIRD